jgi:hypothetical protein
MKKIRAICFFGMLSTVLMVGAAAANQGVKATVIDRIGNRHEVEKLTYQSRLEFPYYVGDKLLKISFAELDRLRLEGERGDEEHKIFLTLRSGEKVSGKVITGGAGVTPHQDSFGGGQTGNRLTGVTDLGPFFILLGDVQEVIMRHSKDAKLVVKEDYRATVIDLSGKRFEVRDVRVFDKERFDYHLGSRKRFKKLKSIAKIEFAEGDGISAEYRPVTITLRSGKTVQGTIDASTVRLAGETDRMYYERVGSAITATSLKGGQLVMGLHEIKLLRFHLYSEEGQAETSAKGNQVPE